MERHPETARLISEARSPRPSFSDDAWTPRRVQRLRELWAEGKTAAAIATAIGTTKSAVSGKAHRLKLPIRPDMAPPPKFWTPERIAEAAGMRQAGRSWVEIATHYGKAKSYVETIIGNHLRQQRREVARATGRPPAEAYTEGRSATTGWALPAGHPVTWGAISPHRAFDA